MKAKWWPEIVDHCPNTPIILVGTKADLRDNEETQVYLKRQGLSFVKRDQGEQMAKKIRAISHLECSALTKRGVKEVFDQVIESVINPKLKSNGNKCVIC